MFKAAVACHFLYTLITHVAVPDLDPVLFLHINRTWTQEDYFLLFALYYFQLLAGIPVL